ncbi:MAG: hypothetical protein IKI60_00880 [Alloprevotella sp.]|nr:hypothetical protein [Alloprevotella sp.]MBR6375512.1 hypothetical protein [Alloprevotella sp.]
MKKSLVVAFSALMLLSLGSCSKDKSKEIKPDGTEFSSGGLAKLVEVVNEPCELKFVTVDGSIQEQHFLLKVKLKLKKETPALQKIDAQDVSFTKLLAVATINLTDDNGVKIQEVSVKDDEKVKLKKLLQGKVGTTEEIVFEGVYHNSDDAPKWFDKIEKFRPDLTADVEGAGLDGEYNLKGSVGDYPIVMSLVIEGSDVKGDYYYVSRGPSNKLKLQGKCKEDGSLDVNETDEYGAPTGHFVGRFENGAFKGEFVNAKGDHYPFAASESGAVSMDDIEMSEAGRGLQPSDIILPSALRGSVSVVPGDMEVTKNSNGFPEVSITFKLNKKVNTAALASAYGQLWIVGVGQDAQGRDVKELLPNYNEWRTHDSDGKEFKEFLEDTPGSTITMTFTGSDDGDVDAGIAKVKKFKLKLTN